jgi:two-component system NtrC family sensor kinase
MPASPHAQLPSESRRESALRAQLASTQKQLRHADKLATVGHIAAGVVHEISNPLGCVFSNFAIMQGYVDDLLRIMLEREQARPRSAGPDSAARLQALRNECDLAILRHELPLLMEETRSGVARVSGMLRNLQDFTRSDSDEIWQWADLQQGIEATVAVAAAVIRQRAAVVREFGELPLLYCLPEQLNQVVMNLVINAAHAIGDQHGTITLRTGVEGGMAWLTVGDTGAGIAPEHLARIFDPYFTTKPVGSGTGLGLSLARDIVHRHQGRIEVASTPGQGSTFRVLLPLLPAGAGC